MVSMTRNESLVFAELRAAQKPLGAYSILDGIRPYGVRSPLQVYRALAKLQALGLVHKLESLNAFVACFCSDERGRGDEHPMSLFTICQGCLRVDESADEIVKETLHQRAKALGFHMTKATIEISGHCEACQTG